MLWFHVDYTLSLPLDADHAVMASASSAATGAFLQQHTATPLKHQAPESVSSMKTLAFSSAPEGGIYQIQTIKQINAGDKVVCVVK